MTSWPPRRPPANFGNRFGVILGAKIAEPATIAVAPAEAACAAVVAFSPPSIRSRDAGRARRTSRAYAGSSATFREGKSGRQIPD